MDNKIIKATVSNILGITLAEVKFDSNGGLTVIGVLKGKGRPA